MDECSRFPAEELVATGGEIYAHVFENPGAGVARDLYWSVSMSFAPVMHVGRQLECSMCCEWIRFGVKDWHELDGKLLDVDYGDEGIESSFSTYEHDIGTHTKMKLTRRKNNVFSVEMEMCVDFQGVCGEDADSSLYVEGVAEIPFVGVLVVPENLDPVPGGVDEVMKVASEHVDLSCFHEAKKWRPHAYRLEPRIHD